MSDVVRLVLLAGSPDTTGTAVIESLKFLSKLLSLSQNKGEQETRHLDGLVAQVNLIGQAELAKVCVYSGSTITEPTSFLSNETLILPFTSGSGIQSVCEYNYRTNKKLSEKHHPCYIYVGVYCKH